MSNPADSWNNAGQSDDCYSLQPQGAYGTPGEKPVSTWPVLLQPHLYAELPSGLATTSPEAVRSLLLGAMALPMFLCPPLSAALGVWAVTTGHQATSSINRSNGMLTGRRLAVLGLLLGYATICCWGIFAAYNGHKFYDWIVNRERTPIIAQPTLDASPESNNLAVATRMAADHPQRAGLGFNETARQMAKMYADEMSGLHRDVFAEQSAKIKRSKFIKSNRDHDYVAWCELHEGRCAFLLFVPDYRRFTDEAKEQWGLLAWGVAQRISGTVLEPNDRLAVALHDGTYYGTVIVGRVPDGQPVFGEGIDQQTFEKGGDLLLPFFVRPEGEVLDYRPAAELRKGPAAELRNPDPNAQLQNKQIDPALNPIAPPLFPQ